MQIEQAIMAPAPPEPDPDEEQECQQEMT